MIFPKQLRVREPLERSDGFVEATDRSTIRPQAQAVFCIDVRSEPLRRHLETDRRL